MDLSPDQIDHLVTLGIDILAVVGGSALTGALLPVPSNRNRVILVGIRRLIDIVGANIFNAKNAKEPQ